MKKEVSIIYNFNDKVEDIFITYYAICSEIKHFRNVIELKNKKHNPFVFD